MFKLEITRITSALLIGTFLSIFIRELNLLSIKIEKIVALDIILILVGISFIVNFITNYEYIKKSNVNFYLDFKIYLYSLMVFLLEITIILLVYK